MALSNFLAEIFGFSLAVAGLALLINQKNIKKLFQLAEDEAMTFCRGIVSFVIGVAIVLVHNIWASDWRVIITILGWLAVIKGVLCMFSPDSAKKWIDKVKDKEWIPIALVVIVLIGCLLIYFGFTR